MVLVERKVDGRYVQWNHQGRARKLRDRESLSNRFSLGWVEVDSPHIKEAGAAGHKVDHPSIWRPARLVVPVFAFCKGDPRSTRRERHVESGIQLCGQASHRLKDNPSAI